MKPNLRYGPQTPSNLLPSWGDHKTQFINAAHEAIYETTQHMEGWQAPGDSIKLFEMGYYAGDIIFEIGTYGGRSAAVALLGALSNPNRKRSPQYFGIDIDPAAISRTYNALKTLALDKYALLIYGNIDTFLKQIDITPTMVFVDGDHSYEGTKADIKGLSEILAEDTPVLFHDHFAPRSEIPEPPPSRDEVTPETMWVGVQKACKEWETQEYAEFYGVFGCSALYVTTTKCTGLKGGLRESRFQGYREALLQYYKNEVAFKMA